VILRIDAAKDMISAIGGIDVVVKSSDCLRYKTGCTGQTIDYDDSWGHLHIHFKQGLQHLDGPQAVAYMRFRHDWCSDPCRIMRQQQVMHAMVAKLKGDQVNTLLHAGSLLQVFRRDVQTDFTDSELLAMASYFQGLPDDAIVQCSGSLHGGRRSARLRRLAASGRRRACTAGGIHAGRSAVARTVARRDGAGRDRTRDAAHRHRQRKRYRGGGASRRGCCSSTPASPSAASGTRPVPTTRPRRFTSTRRHVRGREGSRGAAAFVQGRRGGPIPHPPVPRRRRSPATWTVIVGSDLATAAPSTPIR